MRNDLILALDRNGYLQTARWSDESTCRLRRETSRSDIALSPLRLAEIQPSAMPQASNQPEPGQC